MKFLSLVLMLVSCASCLDNRRGDGPDVKVYVSKPEQGGLVRSQGSEIVVYDLSANYRCLNQEHFDLLIKYCYDPQNGVVDQLRTKASKMSRRKKKRFLKKIAKEIDDMLINEDYDQKRKIENKIDAMAEEI